MADCHVIARTLACLAKADALSSQQKSNLLGGFIQRIILKSKAYFHIMFCPILIEGRAERCAYRAIDFIYPILLDIKSNLIDCWL